VESHIVLLGGRRKPVGFYSTHYLVPNHSTKNNDDDWQRTNDENNQPALVPIEKCGKQEFSAGNGFKTAVDSESGVARQ